MVRDIGAAGVEEARGIFFVIRLEDGDGFAGDGAERFVAAHGEEQAVDAEISVACGRLRLARHLAGVDALLDGGRQCAECRQRLAAAAVEFFKPRVVAREEPLAEDFRCRGELALAGRVEHEQAVLIFAVCDVVERLAAVLLVRRAREEGRDFARRAGIAAVDEVKGGHVALERRIDFAHGGLDGVGRAGGREQGQQVVDLLLALEVALLELQDVVEVDDDVFHEGAVEEEERQVVRVAEREDVVRHFGIEDGLDGDGRDGAGGELLEALLDQRRVVLGEEQRGQHEVVGVEDIEVAAHPLVFEDVHVADFAREPCEPGNEAEVLEDRELEEFFQADHGDHSFPKGNVSSMIGRFRAFDKRIFENLGEIAKNRADFW